MSGMSKIDGKRMTEAEHIVQSIQDILSTPIGSRVMLREYGSRLYDLVDRPIDKMEIFSAIHEALDRWEPRIRLRQVRLVGDGRCLLMDGHLQVELSIDVKTTNESLSVLSRIKP